ncbi:MAG TPA: hypothetical protein VFL55_13515 [Acetobacteraceae bacterium]|nr:hypothetical protein [Acetobacteraceae bacterium]
MNLDLRDCAFHGPALPEHFVHFELGAVLTKLGLLPADATAVEREWSTLRRQLRTGGGPSSVCSHVIAPLARSLGFATPVRQTEAMTREGAEDGGWLLQSPCGARLRAWAFAADTDLDAPHRTGRAYRFSPMRSAQRVLLASGERLGLLTDGDALRLMLCDPARQDSHVAIPLTGSEGWRNRSMAPDSYRLVRAFATPKDIASLSDVLDAARLSQTRVTRDLRVQARHAIEGFLQAVLDHPDNAGARDVVAATTLWHEGLIIVYRLLFILKLESAGHAACAFSFASTRLWRETLSPNRALGPLVRRALDHGHDTGGLLEGGLRFLLQIFRDGLSCSELSVTPLGGALFGAEATPLLDRLRWGERAVALLLDRLLWTMPKGRPRERVHYGALDVEELGHVYEALLELEPGIASMSMARLRRGRLEVVLPTESCAAYRDRSDAAGARTMLAEDIPAGRFHLRAGTGRKTTGSYYTPHAFVRFLVRETLAPHVAARSPDTDPNPGAILSLKVVDPATGSGHFLVEACRFLGEALYAACRMCDEAASAAEQKAEGAPRAAVLRQRLESLPDPDGLLLAYLPSRAADGYASGLSQARALAICRRMVAVHCLYGVDRNGLAIELAKLSLWLESYADGLPLTFLDHRLVRGDSLGGAFLDSLATLPVSGAPLDALLAHDVDARLRAAADNALLAVHALEASVGADAADLAVKSAAKQRLDDALSALLRLARAWSGAVMLATREMDDEWLALAHHVAHSGAWPETLTNRQGAMLEAGRDALPWDLVFPEVFRSRGFDAVLSNPPWDIMHPNTAEFLAGFDLAILESPGNAVRDRLLSDPAIAGAWRSYQAAFVHQQRLVERLYLHQRLGAHGGAVGGKLDLYRVFTERMLRLTANDGAIGMVVPSAFHANEGASGVRRLYLQETRLEQCLSFENRNRLFDIHQRIKFALIVARRPGPTRSVRCGFYLSRFADLEEPGRLMEYDAAFIATCGGQHMMLLELRGRADLALAERLMGHGRFGDWTERAGISLSREIHMTDDAGLFRAASGPGQLPLHEGKTIHQFSDAWERPRHAIAVADLSHKPRTLQSARFYRLACREVARSTDERTAIATMLPPGVLCGHTISVERTPERRSNASALLLLAVMNSFPFDWMLRQRAAAHASLYILAELPVPKFTAIAERFLAHAALRLSCNHAGFAALWHEQLGNAAAKQSWPAIGVADQRWQLRAEMDAVVAHAYGLDRAQYQRLLDSFSHKSFPTAPALCLAAYDVIAAIKLKQFCANRDPYCAIPLMASCAQPALRLTTTSSRQRSLMPAPGRKSA